MSEDFLYYLWKYQYFDKHNLKSVGGERIVVLATGHQNYDSGPDFSQSRIVIDDLEWSGQVEMHIRSSEWYRHGHQHDTAYDSVILHVVWQHDKEVYRSDGSLIPVIEMKNIVDHHLVLRYKRFLAGTENLICRTRLQEVDPVIWGSMVDNTLVERLRKRSEDILEKLQTNGGDWMETFYQVLAGCFGFRVNKEPFHILSRILPFRIIRKHIGDLFTLEALLLGQAGFLSDQLAEDYPLRLRKEFGFLSAKYGLEVPMAVHVWKFSRTRPSNFPTIRIAQFAAFLYHHPSLYSEMLHRNELPANMTITTSRYWQNHYRFGKQTSRPFGFGKNSFQNLVINGIAPLWFAYGLHHHSQPEMDLALSFLEKLPPESNRVIKLWISNNVQPVDAAQSQGLLQLYNEYCANKRCLECKIGVSILND